VFFHPSHQLEVEQVQTDGTTHLVLEVLVVADVLRTVLAAEAALVTLLLQHPHREAMVEMVALQQLQQTETLEEEVAPL
jgi:hypothetical protein